MGARLAGLVEIIRRAKGPFFLARLALRLPFPLMRAASVDDAHAPELIAACRELGFDPSNEALETG